MSIDAWQSCPTHRLLLHCLYPPVPRESLADPTLDWQYFLQLAYRHQIAPLASRALNAEDTIPATIVTALAKRRTRNARRALAQLAELGRLIQRFRAADLPVLPVKGPLLAAQLYGDPGLRQCGDLDLLVDPTHVTRAAALLREAGCRRNHPDFSLSPRQHRAFLKNYNQMAFQKTSPPLTVELHWRWFRNRYFFTPDIAELLQASDTVNIGGLTVATPPPEDLLLYLCAHGAKHAWYNLKWLADIPPLLARLDDPDALVQRAGQLALRRVLAQTLVLCRDLLSTSLSPPLTALIDAEPNAHALATHARRVMLRDDRRDRSIGDKLRRWRYMTRLKTTPAYRWRETAGYLSNCEDWRTLPLPDRLFWLYYPLRPLLWLRR